MDHTVQFLHFIGWKSSPPPPEGKRCAKGTQPIGNTAESQHSTIMPIYSFIQALLSTSY